MSHARLLLAIPFVAALAACDVAAGLFAPPTASPSPSASPSAMPSAAPSASPGASAAPSATPTPVPGLPTEAPTIEGEVLSAEPAGGGSLHSGRIHVASTDGSNQAMVTLVGATQVWRQAGKLVNRAATTDLKVGQRVSVWAGGPIRESFPIQFDAKAVLILAEP